MRRSQIRFKRIGALWNKQDKNEQPYFCGQIDLGALGAIKVMVFPNKHKEEENHLDAIISLVTNEDDGK